MSPLTRRCIPDRRTVLSIVGVLLVVVVIVGAGAYMVLGRPDAEGRVSSSETPPTATASALASASVSRSAGEQALRDAALSTPKPERPAGMDELSPEGLRLAGEYVLALYPYVYATGDLSDWQAMSTPDCGFCNNVITNVTETHIAGGWVDPTPQEVVAETYGVTDRDPDVWGVTFHITHGAGTRHDGSGGTSTVEAEDLTFLLQMRWTGQTWIVEAGGER